MMRVMNTRFVRVDWHQFLATSLGNSRVRLNHSKQTAKDRANGQHLCLKRLLKRPALATASRNFIS